MARCPLQAKLAEKELRGKPLEDLTWHTPEGIAIKPVYTQDDLEGHVAELPGQFPFTRGPKATMYVATPPSPLIHFVFLINSRGPLIGGQLIGGPLIGGIPPPP